jgi:hypothetical protein
MTEHLRQNPYRDGGKWYWIDETGDISQPYDRQSEALRDLADYCIYLDTGKVPFRWRWKRFMKLVSEFIHS